jgi:TBC1 domain family member 8/9
MKEIESMRLIVTDAYSEYLLSLNAKPKDGEPEQPVRQPPDAGLGLVFRYPGDARKLRDRSKMRLWAEYLRGMVIAFYFS